MRDFEHFILGATKPEAVARQTADRTIDQIRRDVYDSHRHRVFALAYYMTGNELKAEELLARCFTRAFTTKKVPNGMDVDSSLLEELHADGMLSELTQWTLTTTGAALEARNNILRTDLEEAVHELPAAERLIFLLSDVEGYRVEAIAKLMGKPEAEISRALMGARLMLRQTLAVLQKKRETAA